MTDETAHLNPRINRPYLRLWSAKRQRPHILRVVAKEEWDSKGQETHVGVVPFVHNKQDPRNP